MRQNLQTHDCYDRKKMMIPTIPMKSFYDIKFNFPISNRPKKKFPKAYGSSLLDCRYI